MGIKRYHDRLLAQLSNSLSASTIDLNRLELERLGRKAVAAGQFRELLADLKGRVARRAALRAGGSLAIPRAELPSQAA